MLSLVEQGKKVYNLEARFFWDVAHIGIDVSKFRVNIWLYFFRWFKFKLQKVKVRG